MATRSTFHLTSLNPQPSSLIPHLFSLILNSFSLISHLSSLTPPPPHIISASSSFLPPPSPHHLYASPLISLPPHRHESGIRIRIKTSWIRHTALPLPLLPPSRPTLSFVHILLPPFLVFTPQLILLALFIYPCHLS